MMQSDILDDRSIRMVQQNHQRYVYSLQKEPSKKIVKSKNKINIKGVIASIAIGTIVVSGMFNIKGNAAKTTKPIEIPSGVTTVSTEQPDIVLESEEKVLLHKYCNDVYGIKYDVAYALASKLTNNFTSETYIETNNPAYSINNKKCTSKEQGFLTFVRHLSQIPGDFGMSLADVQDLEFQPTKKGNEEYKVKYYSDLFGVDPVLALAIEYQEASKDGLHYSSDAYNEFNNPAGLIDPSTQKLWVFQSPDEGIIEHIYQLKKYYIDKGLTTPEAIKTTYAPDGAKNDPTNLNHNWLYGVKYFMDEIKNTPNIFEYKNVEDTVSKAM